MIAANPAYMEIVEFIAGGTTPEAVANFHPSEAAQRRISELLALNAQGLLATDEPVELDHFVELEHILRMARARARQIVNKG